MKYEILFDENKIEARRRKITNAFAGKPVQNAEDFPVIVSTPNYFAFASRDRDETYFDSPENMLKFQAEAYQRHLDEVDDDFVPYFMPWYGTGVLASAFGCENRYAGGDPGVSSSAVHTIREAAKLKKPDLHTAGEMPRVLETISYARQNSNLPVGLTDMCSPLNALAQICGYDNLYVWMYEEPGLVHDLMALVCETVIDWVKLQKEYIGEPLDQSNGLQGVWSPKGVGIWLSDDDLVSMNAELYETFVVPYYSKVFETFGGASLHYCGVGNHQIDNFAKIKGLKAINNSPLGHFEEFSYLLRNKPQGVMVQIQDNLPLDYDAYYDELFRVVDSVDGMMVATWVLDSLAMLPDGTYTEAAWDSMEAANGAVRAIRRAVAKNLEGKREKRTCSTQSK